jgi:hypothetical protein
LLAPAHDNFDIANATGVVREVSVDPMTGKVVGDVIEDSGDDSGESQEKTRL